MDELVTSLKFQNIGTDAIHGDITQAARLAALRRFQAGTVRVLVATDVAARGLDISGLPLVVNLDLPVAPEGYVHRVGRTARAGAAGEAISLVCADEAVQLNAIETLIGKPLQRREIQGFEPRHTVPVTGPNQRPPSLKAMKGTANKTGARKKRVRAAKGTPAGKKKSGGKPGPGKAAAAHKPRKAPA